MEGNNAEEEEEEELEAGGKGRRKGKGAIYFGGNIEGLGIPPNCDRKRTSTLESSIFEASDEGTAAFHILFKFGRKEKTKY